MKSHWMLQGTNNVGDKKSLKHPQYLLDCNTVKYFVFIFIILTTMYSIFLWTVRESFFSVIVRKVSDSRRRLFTLEVSPLNPISMTVSRLLTFLAASFIARQRRKLQKKIVKCFSQYKR